MVKNFDFFIEKMNSKDKDATFFENYEYYPYNNNYTPIIFSH